MDEGPRLYELFSDRLLETEMEEIEYKTWTMTDRSTIVTQSCPADEFAAKLCDNLEKLLLHDFIATKQSAFFKETKNALKVGEFLVVMDYSENYAFTIQNAVQAYHWNNNSATLFPVVIYYKEKDDDELKHCSFMGISDCLKHDTVGVHMFQVELIKFLKEKFHEISKVIYFTDGARSQFKNKKSFANLANHFEDFGIQADWHFFATAHGKGPSDGLGGQVKRLARLASLKMGSESHIISPNDFYVWVRDNVLNVHSVFCCQADYDYTAEKLSVRFEDAKRVVGTASYHCVLPSDSPKSLKFKTFSSCERWKEISVMK